jgi:hypothetical protein
MHGITSPEWSAFIGTIKAANAALGDPEIAWYRGHPDVHHDLLASPLRYANGLEKEKYLFDRFQKSPDRIFKRRTSDWETLFEMQHYGVPTRFLGWTESFGVALFFAAYYNKRHGSGTDPRSTCFRHTD